MSSTTAMYDSGLVSRIEDALLQIGQRRVRQKNVFGGRGFMLGKQTFAIAWGDGLLVKTTAREYQSLLGSPGITPFAPAGERAMGRWLVVSADAIADDPQLVEWLRRGIDGIR